MRRSLMTLRECMERAGAEGVAAPAFLAARRGDGEAQLVDRYGRAVTLGATTTIGRDPSEVEVALRNDSVSRRHAVLTRDGDLYSLRDLGSTNGTFVDGQRVTGTVVLRDGQLVQVGTVGFVFLRTQPAAEPAPVPVESDLKLVSLVSGGGRLEMGGVVALLDPAEVCMVRFLAEKRAEEASAPEATRGFVRSVELAARLQSAGQAQAASLVKALARRVQRQLKTVGAEAVLESNDRLGYRLRMAIAM